MDTKERTRQPKSNKPKERIAGQGTPRTRQQITAPKKSNAKGQTQTPRRNSPQAKQKRSIAEDVVYLPPKPFSRKRLLLRLATVVAVVFALVFGISIFFKVDEIVISGNEKYSAEAIMEAAGIRKGDKLLTFSRAKAGGKIIGKLPFVESVRFGIKLPGTVHIEITEVDVGYAASDVGGIWWMISSEGKVLQRLSSGENSGYTKILGVQLDTPIVGNQAVALSEEQIATDEAGNTIPVAITAEKRLNTALEILQYMEQNGIIGEAVFVDVTDLGNIHMQYDSRYQIELGNNTELFEKIKRIKGAVAKVSEEYPYSAGTIDLSNLEKNSFDPVDPQ